MKDISLNTVSQNVFDKNKVKKNGDPLGAYVEKADFETAITATGFGKFNIKLLVLAIPACWTTIFQTTTMSFVFPAAQCDLELSLTDKGYLNAITYLGMISSAFVWGYLFDTLGRKKLLMIAFLADTFFVCLSSTSQNLIVLMFCKYMGGFIINGPYAALTSYLCEFHCAKYRPKVQMLIGTFNSVGQIILPALAWVVLPYNLDFEVGGLEFHSWNIYLLVCSLPSCISGITFLFLPESPKFLMTVGKNKEAMEIFQKVYSINYEKPMSSFMIKSLIDETQLKQGEKKHGGRVTANRTKVQALREGLQQIKPLFYPPYLARVTLVCVIQLLLVLGVNTIRLWLPQIFQAIEDYNYSNNGSSASLCQMLDDLRPSNATEECFVNTNNSGVYINSIIVSTVAVAGYAVVTPLINFFGKKAMLVILGVAAGSSATGMYFAQDSVTTTVLSSIFIGFGCIGANVVIAVIVDLFPTIYRTFTISLVMMLARMGAMFGNMAFPILLETGCAPPFFFVGSILIGSGLLSLALPNTDMKALE